jgi:hypothetical protein
MPPDKIAVANCRPESKSLFAGSPKSETTRGNKSQVRPSQVRSMANLVGHTTCSRHVNAALQKSVATGGVLPQQITLTRDPRCI